MNEDKTVVTDPEYRVENPSLEHSLKEYEQEKLARAEKKEQERLEKPSLWDAFFNGIARIKKMFSRDTNINNNAAKSR